LSYMTVFSEFMTYFTYWNTSTYTWSSYFQDG
jgi:hypothetical protein